MPNLHHNDTPRRHVPPSRRLRLTSEIPYIVSARIRRAQKLYALAWFDYDLIKVGELVALTALKLALKDRYGGRLADPGKKPPMLHVLLRHMVEKDGFTDEILPLVQRYGGSVLPYLYEADEGGCQHKLRSLESVTVLPTVTHLMGFLGAGCSNSCEI
jgi:hypothetical protein